MIKITYEELMNRVENQRKDTQFYRINALNYTGRIENGDSYSEVLADWLYQMSKDEEKEVLLRNAHMVEPEKWTAGPIQEERGEIIFSEGSNRDEENIAKRMMQEGGSYVSNFPGTRLVDYQVPINRVLHSSEGKADLILVGDRHTYIGELKDMDSKETLLRAMVEARTYQLKINTYSFVHERFKRCYGHASIQTAVLLFEGTKPWKDFMQMRSQSNNSLQSLAAKWDILFFKVICHGSLDAGIENCVFELEWI